MNVILYQDVGLHTHIASDTVLRLRVIKGNQSFQ